MWNPYLDEVGICSRKPRPKHGWLHDQLGAQHAYSDYAATYTLRNTLAKRYSWAIPDTRAIEIVLAHSPIVDFGAGTGYWAAVLSRAGADVVAYDTKPYRNSWCDAKWHPVVEGGPDVLEQHSDRTLLLVWPPYNTPMGAACLRRWRGQTLIFVGEGAGGCTADDEFFATLERELYRTDTHFIPRWDGLNDYLSVWCRRPRQGG
jgi:hypothetical protein